MDDVEGVGEGLEATWDEIVRFCDSFEAEEETSPLKALSWLCR